jgi:Nodulation protein Z (NodZ)
MGLTLSNSPAFSSSTVKLHIICERDVGLFSLIQQVISNVAWAIEESRTPVVYFQGRTCYWTPNGYHDGDTVWEYYFEPLVSGYSADRLAPHVRAIIDEQPPLSHELGYFADEHTFVSGHFGDHPDLEGKSLFIPYLTEDPNDPVRRAASGIIRDFVRPRPYIREQVEQFFKAHLEGHYVIGVHIRGTDAISKKEMRPHRKGSLNMVNYVREIEGLLDREPEAKIFVATDAEVSLNYLKASFGNRIVACESIRHQNGEAAGMGPTGWLMPAYIAGDREQAARNGAEAVIEWLMLTRSNYLVHNGSSLSRTVLLSDPDMPHINTHWQAISGKYL